MSLPQALRVCQPQFSELPDNQCSFHKETRVAFLVRKKGPTFTKESECSCAYADLEIPTWSAVSGWAPPEAGSRDKDMSASGSSRRRCQAAPVTEWGSEKGRGRTPVKGVCRGDKHCGQLGG